MENIYLFCFVIGILYVVFMLIMGDILDLSFIHVPFLSSTTLLAFLVTFGGTGLYLEQTTAFSGGKTFSLAFLIGLIIFLLSFFLVALPLQRSEKTAALSIHDAIGTIGTMTVPCENQQLGEIVYSQNNIRITAPARGINNERIDAGTEVYISQIDNGILIVRKKSKII